VLAVAIAGYALYMVADLYVLRDHPLLGPHYRDRPVALLSHLGLGAIALMIGPFQFLEKFRQAQPWLHRWSGWFYVFSCLASGLAAISLAFHSSQGLVAQAGFVVLGGLWIATTTSAFLMARSRDFAQHKRWMIRSYALTYAAVSLRIILPAELALGVPFDTAYSIVAWACWVPNLLIAEWGFLRRQRPVST